MRYSFFPQTIRDWNDLPESLISSFELSDDSVSKFTSLVELGTTHFPQSKPMVRDCQFGVSPVNYSDSGGVAVRKHCIPDKRIKIQTDLLLCRLRSR